MYNKFHYIACFTLVMVLAGTVPAVPLAPDDGSIKDNLCIWLRTPEVNFGPSTGAWVDVSGKGNNAETVGEVPVFNVTYVLPTLSFGMNSNVFEHPEDQFFIRVSRMNPDGIDQ